MKTKENIINNVFADQPKKALVAYREAFLKVSEPEFALIVFGKLFLDRIYQCKLKDIENNNISIHYDKVLEAIKEEFSIVKPMLELEENHLFFKKIKDGTETLYYSLKNIKNIANKTFFEGALKVGVNHLNDEAVSTLITFIQGGNLSYTSTQFMKSHDINVISKISEASNENILYTYLYDNHWYLLLLEGDIYNVIDIRGKSKVFKKSFIEGHSEIAAQISYIDTFNIQSAIEKMLGIDSPCGKICISINNFLAEQKGSITKEHFSVMNSSLQTNPEFYRSFVKSVISLIKEEPLPLNYIIDDTYLIRGITKVYLTLEPSELDSLTIFTPDAHKEFINTLEYNKGFLSNWNIIQYITLGLMALTSLYLAYNTFFSDNGNVADSDSINESLIGDIIQFPEDL